MAHHLIKMEKERKEHKLDVIKFRDRKICLPEFSYYTNSKWITFGLNNLFPQEMVILYNESPAHSATIKRLTQLVAGDGLVLGENRKLNDWIDRAFHGDVDRWIRDCAQDFLISNGIGSQVLRSNDGRSIASVSHLGTQKIRVSTDLRHVYVSSDRVYQTRAYGRPVELPLLDAEKSKEKPIQVLYWFEKDPGNDWYPIPSYYGAISYVALDRDIARYYQNYVANGFSSSYLITAYGKDISPEEQRELKRNIENNLIGPDSAGKFMLQVAPDREAKWDFDPLNTADNSKMYETLQEWSQKQIMIAHHIDMPELFGQSSGGASLGGDANKLVVGYEQLQNTKIKPIQNILTNLILKLARMSGISCSKEDLFISNSLPVKAVDLNVLTVNERRELAGYEAIEGQDIILSSFRPTSKKTEMVSQVDYGCLMLDLDILERDDLKAMIDPEDVYEGDLEYGGLQNEPHVTVLYGFHDDVLPSDVMELMNHNPEEIQLSVSRLNRFEAEDYDVLKFEVDSEELVRFNETLRANFNHTMTHPKYNPHITLTYLKKSVGDKYDKVFQDGIEAIGHQFVYKYKKGKKKITWK